MPTQNSYRTQIIILAVVGVLVAIAIVVHIIRPNLYRRTFIYFNTGSQERILNTALDAANAGDFASARAQSWDLVRSTLGEDEAALSIYDTSSFMTGEAAARVNAIRTTKQHYEQSAGDPYAQALQVNKLLGYYNSAREKYVFDEIFAGEPFDDLLVPGDTIGSIRKLAEHSIALSPTTAAVFRLGQWNAEQIEKGEKTLTAEQKNLYVENILDVISAADTLIEKDLVAIEGRPFDYTVKARYFFWKSYLYGVAARVQPQYLEDSARNLNELVAYYEATRNESGEQYALIAARLPYAYASNSVALYKVHGEEAVSDIAKNLDALISIISDNPSIHKGEYLAYINRRAKISQTDPEKASASYRALAEMHAPFKVFLESYGWQF